jgi:hypothetical protein
LGARLSGSLWLDGGICTQQLRHLVMAVLAAASHVFLAASEAVDGRDEPCNDAEKAVSRTRN